MSMEFYSKLKLHAPATESNDAVTKGYVDAAVDGKIKEPVAVVSTTNLAATYDGTVMTLTMDAAGAVTVDGVVLNTANMRVLIAEQTDKKQNGIYTVTTVGDASTAAVFTRADDFNTTDKIRPNTIIPVSRGTEYGDTVWMVANDTTPTLDTDDISFTTYTAPEGVIQLMTTFAGDGTKTEFHIKYEDINADVTDMNYPVVQIMTNDGTICFFDINVDDSSECVITTATPIENGKTFRVTIIGEKN